MNSEHEHHALFEVKLTSFIISEFGYLRKCRFTQHIAPN